MTVTLLHVLLWPLAYVTGYLAGMATRKRSMRWLEAYAYALIPGLLIAIASATFGADFPSGNEQPWEGLLIWMSWAGLGVLGATRSPRRQKVTTLGLASRQQ